MIENVYRVKFKANFLVEGKNEQEAYDNFEEQIDLSQVIITKVKGVKI